ncbi:MAG: hypothetical protein IJY61_08530 [Candidatus Gastranaerophilales bacterium]|nr:hypothetical protein [Candidatus Gastranaerophilales bacterium]
MTINSVNNVSFSARNPEAKAMKKANKEQYFKYLSQVNANDALKMSVGREVEDGKLKSASAKAFLGGLVGLVGSQLLMRGAANKSIALDQVGKLTDKAAKGLANTIKVGVVANVVSSVALVSSAIIDSVNKSRANKTAHARGFLNDGDYSKFTSKQEAYEVTDMINKAHVN